MPLLFLASQSPRRRKILHFAGISFKVVKPINVAEKRKNGEGPKELVRRLAVEKAANVSTRFPTAWVLGADTVVVCGGDVFGKPRNRQEAGKMLSRLQGRSHHVWTGCALMGNGGRWIKSHAEKTKVYFRKFEAGELEAYLDSKEPYDKAGAYDIQGTARTWVRQWEGDYFNVMGLPLQWVVREINGLKDLG
jgi:septum formation protein